jgi:hypothetical protein
VIGGRYRIFVLCHDCSLIRWSAGSGHGPNLDNERRERRHRGASGEQSKSLVGE